MSREGVGHEFLPGHSMNVGKVRPDLTMDDIKAYYAWSDGDLGGSDSIDPAEEREFDAALARHDAELMFALAVELRGSVGWKDPDDAGRAADWLSRRASLRAQGKEAVEK